MDLNELKRLHYKWRNRRKIYNDDNLKFVKEYYGDDSIELSRVRINNHVLHMIDGDYNKLVEQVEENGKVDYKLTTRLLVHRILIDKYAQFCDEVTNGKR